MRARRLSRSTAPWYILLSVAVMVVLATVVRVPEAAAVPDTRPDNRFWETNGRVLEILETDDAVYLAGKFTALVGPQGQVQTRNRLAALDPDTGAPLAFNPNMNGDVWSLEVSGDGSRLYAGGDFTRVGGVTRTRVAAFDTGTGALESWNPRADGRVKGIAAVPGRVILGGRFTTLDGANRPNLGAVSPATGGVQSDWDTTTNGIVHDIVVSPDGARVLVGGDFATVSGTAAGSQRKITSLDPGTGNVQPWASHPNFEFFDLDATQDRLFAAAGGSGGHAVAWDLSTGQQQWVGFGDGDAVAVGHQNGTVYVGGHFNRWLGETARHIVAVEPETGERVPWDVSLNSALGTWAIESFRGNLSVGGDFTRVNGVSREHFARFAEGVDSQPPTVPGRPVGQVAGPTSVELTWPGSDDDLAHSITYFVYRDGSTQPVDSVSAAPGVDASFTDTDLNPGSTHTWAVRASDGANLSGLSASSAPVTLPASDAPVLTGMVMLDRDTDGRVDAIDVDFSSPVTCAAPCTAPWSLANVPSGGSLASVDADGSTVTLRLSEGTGRASTAVGGLRVALDGRPDGVVDADGDAASFGPTAPDDRAGPVPRDLTSANNGNANNVMEPGDTFTVTFTEPIDPATLIAANAKQFDPAGAGPDQLIIVGLTDTPIDLNSDAYVVPDGGTVVYQNSTLSLLSGNTQVRSTVVAPCSGTACGREGPGAESVITFAPEPFLKDASGNQAVGSRSESEGVY